MSIIGSRLAVGCHSCSSSVDVDDGDETRRGGDITDNDDVGVDVGAGVGDGMGV